MTQLRALVFAVLAIAVATTPAAAQAPLPLTPPAPQAAPVPKVAPKVKAAPVKTVPIKPEQKQAPETQKGDAAAASAAGSDPAFGAFQRGHFRTAFTIATRQVEERGDVKAMTL
jgi:uncharacterized protein